MNKVKKFLGWLTRLLLAAGAEKWKVSQPVALSFAATEPAGPQPGAQSYDPAKSAGKVGAQTWLLLLALVGDALLNALLEPGALEGVLGAWKDAPVPVIYAALAWLRDRVRHG